MISPRPSPVGAIGFEVLVRCGTTAEISPEFPILGVRCPKRRRPLEFLATPAIGLLALSECEVCEQQDHNHKDTEKEHKKVDSDT